MPLPKGIYRADHVGSLLRPKEILKARADDATPDQLRPLEDKYVSSLVPKELDNGLRSITDGEFRRAFFHIDFLKHLAGVDVEGSMNSTHSSREGFRPPRLLVTDKISHTSPIQVKDFHFLQTQIAAANATTHATPKVCIPSPTMVHFRGDRDTISSTAYPNPDSLFPDLVTAYRAEIDALYRAGCRLIQLDDTNLAYLCDSSMRREAESRHGIPTSTLLAHYTRLINDTITPRPADLVIAIHLCRGNHRSRWFAQGGYEPVAETLFRDLDVNAYFLEYDDARSGDFSPLRHLPEGKTVVLGVMSSKTPQLDDKEVIKKRLREAAAFCPGGMDQLCLSHQCGFSSTMEGNELTEEQQWVKIRLEVEIAKEVWGDDLSV